MTTEQQATQPTEQKNNIEYNFRQLEAKFERQLAAERAAREQAEKLAREALEAKGNARNKKDEDFDEDDDYQEPYVDDKRLKKKLDQYSEKTINITKSEIQKAVQNAIAEERRQSWLKSNSDFYEIMKLADKFAETDPELADSILEMPDTFERQKLVYKNIKALGLHKAPEPKIQEKITNNRKNLYYQPSGINPGPYAAAEDFSSTGQKQAYEKMQELKKRLRLS